MALPKAKVPKTIGVLLINTGTPEAPTYFGVRRYLRQFLSDARVLDMPRFSRFLLLHFLILPLRSARSAQAYRKIWTSQGSPLRTHTLAFRERLQHVLGETYKVVYAMRYGQPSIASAWQELKDCTELVIFPLYPHYAASSTASALAEAMRVVSRDWNVPITRVIAPFFQDPGFLSAFAERIQNAAHTQKWEHLVFSFHGLPQHHIQKSGCAGSCAKHSCTVEARTSLCYRAQCFATVRELVQLLQIQAGDYSVGFQSRLGSRPWIKPYFDELLVELRQKGIQRLAVVCPSFVADCLETLEEIRIRARATWQALGGEELLLIPCLNEAELWVQAAGRMVRQSSAED